MRLVPGQLQRLADERLLLDPRADGRGVVGTGVEDIRDFLRPVEDERLERVEQPHAGPAAAGHPAHADGHALLLDRLQQRE